MKSIQINNKVEARKVLSVLEAIGCAWQDGSAPTSVLEYDLYNVVGYPFNLHHEDLVLTWTSIHR